MTLFKMWVETAAAQALGWTLVHSLWEGAIVAVALAAALCVFRSARVRYAAACAAMLVLVAGVGLTLIRVIPNARAGSGEKSGSFALALTDTGQAPLAAGAEVGSRISDLLPWLALFWIAGAFLFHLRHLANWIAARRLLRIGVCCPPVFWQEQLDRLALRVRLSKPVKLLESSLVEVPAVIGWLRPVVLVPAGLLAGLPPGQLEAVLLHELAHIRRFDYLVNLLQTSVEGLLFYHPAAWWISKVIRTERENCCDDLVVSTNGNVHEYAVALATLEENRAAFRQAVLAATGGDLVKRVRRLLNQPEGPGAAFAPVFSAGILTIAAAVGLAAWQQPAASRVPPPYDKWLNEDVAYLITEPERAAFRNLQTDSQREQFIMQFWVNRDPTPDTPANEFKTEHYRRIAYANERFKTARLSGWKTDRGRIYIIYGPPDEIESHPAGVSYQRPPEQGGGTTSTYPLEQWLYRSIEGRGSNIIMDFVDPTRSGEYRMTTDPHGNNAPVSAPRQ